jgi:hypothetical protein
MREWRKTIQGTQKVKKPISEIQEIKPVCKPIHDHKRWVPLDLGWQSLSVDASFIEDTNSASWGVGIRDHLGQINLSDWGLIPICDGAESSEAIACLEGIKLGINHSCLIVGSDCAAVINKASSFEIIDPKPPVSWQTYNAWSLCYRMSSLGILGEKTKQVSS